MTIPFPAGSSVSAYLRDSGGDHQDLSTGQQLIEIQKFCGHNRLILHGIYRDEASPGSTVVGREGFLQMIDDFTAHGRLAQAGIVIWKFSRFARDIDDAQYFKTMLRRAGYAIHSLSENIPPGIDGRLFEAVVDWHNAKFLADLSQDVKRGLRHNVNQYGAVGGVPPRGFRRGEDIDLGMRRNGAPHRVHRWEPVPELVPLIRLAFQMRARGASYDEITREVGIYTAKESWRHFFGNEIYTGRLRYGDQVIEDYCEPIVDRKTWEAVQMINSKSMSKRNMDLARHPRARSSDYILTGLLRCKACGGPMTGETVHSNRRNHTNRYYSCLAKKKTYGRGCTARNIPKDLIELTVLKELTENILKPQNLLEVKNEETSLNARTVEDLLAQMTVAEKRQTELIARIRNLSRVMTDPVLEHSRHLPVLLRELETEELEAAQEVKRLAEELARVSNLPSDPDLLHLAEQIPAKLRDADRPTLRNWLHALIEHIDAERVGDKISGQIWYYLPDDVMPTGLSHRGTLPHRHNFINVL